MNDGKGWNTLKIENTKNKNMLWRKQIGAASFFKLVNFRVIHKSKQSRSRIFGAKIFCLIFRGIKICLSQNRNKTTKHISKDMYNKLFDDEHFSGWMCGY